ncbi:MAG: hypothetical protein E7265_01420 [Lachnospiraceae bacterium]|nr:hypothetical protein [Lachnospiraceae bacterium]
MQIAGLSPYLNNGYFPNSIGQAKSLGFDKATISSMVKSGQIECETCANRKYQDGSDEMVSFKAPAHISPGSSAARVASHEHEHVSNAYSKAAMNNGRVIRASVTLNTSVCPECGRSYVSGGETTTQIKYNESNPYDKNKKSIDVLGLLGNNVDVRL